MRDIDPVARRQRHGQVIARTPQKVIDKYRDMFANVALIVKYIVSECRCRDERGVERLRQGGGRNLLIRTAYMALQSRCESYGYEARGHGVGLGW